MSDSLIARIRLLLALAIILVSCSNAPTPASVTPTTADESMTQTAAARPSATHTPAPTQTPVPTHTATTTALPTETFTPTELPTETSTPTTAPTGTATRKPAPTRPPFTPTPTATDTPSGPTAIPSTGFISAEGGGNHGVTGILSLEAQRTTFTAKEPVWFTFDLNNSTGQPVPYGILGVVVIDLDPSDGNGGLYHTSWNGELAPGGAITLNPGPFHHRDFLQISTPGAYKLYVSMCFSAFNDCRSGGDWENVSGPIVVTVQP